MNLKNLKSSRDQYQSRSHLSVPESFRNWASSLFSTKITITFPTSFVTSKLEFNFSIRANFLLDHFFWINLIIFWTFIGIKEIIGDFLNRFNFERRSDDRSYDRSHDLWPEGRSGHFKVTWPDRASGQVRGHLVTGKRSVRKTLIHITSLTKISAPYLMRVGKFFNIYALWVLFKI